MENKKYDFTKLSEVPLIEDVLDEDSVIVETGGDIRRVPTNTLGKVKTVNGTEPDENGNIEVDTVSSWNDLKSKPFYEEVKKEMIIDSYEHVLTGETRFDDYDKEYVNYPNFEIDGTAFNETWTTGEELYLLCNGVEYKGVVEINKGGEMIYFDSAELSPIILPNERNPNLFTVYPANSSDLTKLEVPITFSLYRKPTEVKQLDKKFLPQHNHSWRDVAEEIKWLLTDTKYTGGAILMSESIEVGKTYIISINGYEYSGVASEQYNGVEYAPYVNIKGAGIIERNALSIYTSEGSIVSVREVDYNTVKEEYIPNTIPRIQTADVGQTIVVKEVDEDGKPSEWECVDVNIYKLSDIATYDGSYIGIEVAKLPDHGLFINDLKLICNDVRYLDSNGNPYETANYDKRPTYYPFISVNKDDEVYYLTIGNKYIKLLNSIYEVYEL